MRRYLLGDIRYIIVNPAPKVNIRTKHTAHGAGISAVSALFPGGFFCYTGKTDRGPDGPACGRRAPTARALELFHAAFDSGLLVRATGDIIALSPPLIVEKADIDAMFGKLAELLDRID